MYEIGTQITYNKLKYTVIGYKKNLESLWYKIKPVNSTSHHYTVTSGKYFSNIIPKKILKTTIMDVEIPKIITPNIIPKKTLKVTSISTTPIAAVTTASINNITPTISISTKYKTPDELKSIYTPTITSTQSIGTIGLIIIGYIIYKLIK